MSRPRAGRLERQRDRVRELLRADPNRSSRSIAIEIGCSTHTVIRQRTRVQVHEPNGTPTTAHAGSANLMAPAGPGNDRAVTHGAYSAARRAPLEQHHRERLRRTYPIASDDLVNSAAKRAAMIDLFSAWIEDAGVVHAQRGLPTVSAPAIELRRLLNDHEAAMERLEESAATPAPGRLAQHLAANYGEQHVEGSARDSSSDAESA